ncbi:hypothetical protein HNQ50_000286 [Silvimonas terrae]|uniref:Autochaperone domain-containing protein n=1 Tax=Silvimonas terrae TaxID=300266 RepID=A0A840RAU7_9NEIS|nr:autotransporter outer membrane beta-barrel domain-containing protein [Silvimonas terrae]MBB5189576.1 hypothetical protein [Silvimonas terrae]
MSSPRTVIRSIWSFGLLNAATTYTGSTTLAAGTFATGAAGIFSRDFAFTVQPAVILDRQGFDQTLTSLTNSGLVRTGGSAEALLTTTNYIGRGGTLAIDTYLAADNSPSDKVVINGGIATGTTTLTVRNAGGSGILTTADGIWVIQTKNGGTTATEAFMLGGEARGGALDYRLF